MYLGILKDVFCEGQDYNWSTHVPMSFIVVLHQTLNLDIH